MGLATTVRGSRGRTRSGDRPPPRAGRAAAAVAAFLLPALFAGNLAWHADRAIAQDKAKRPISLAFVTNNPSDYWTVCHKGVDKAAPELPGVKVQFIMPADGTAATQASEVNDLLSRGVQGIAISPVDPANETRDINNWCRKASVITTDSDAPQSNRVCYIGTDNDAAGVMAAELLKRALPRGGRVMLCVGLLSAQNAHDRIQGIRQGLAGSRIQIIGVLTDDADHARARQNVVDVLTRDPRIAGLVGIWSYNGPAIADALQETGKARKVKVVAFDSDPGTLAGIRSGVIYGTVAQQPYRFGYESVKLLAQLVQDHRAGIPASRDVYVPTLAITRSNVKKYVAEQTKLLGGP